MKYMNIIREHKIKESYISGTKKKTKADKHNFINQCVQVFNTLPIEEISKVRPQLVRLYLKNWYLSQI